jgi:hypothetical protein
MQKFSVEVVETSTRVIDINAISEDEAVKLVEELYRAGTVILDSNDFQDVEFNII